MATNPAAEPASEPRQVQVRVTARPRSRRIRVDLLTDPWSVWCWGFEPVRRTIELRYPTLEFRFVLGGMFETLPRPEETGFDLDTFFATVQRTTGMPIRNVQSAREHPESTYPACIAVHAARIAAPSKETVFLRAMREAAYLDGLNISRPSVASQVAARVGIPKNRFQEILASGQAEDTFRKTVERLQRQGLHAYPTLMFRTERQLARVEGFQGLPAVLQIAESLTGRVPAPLPDPTLDRVVPAGERVATREVAEVLGISAERAFELLAAAEGRGELKRQRFPTGDVWRRMRAVTPPEIVPAP